MRHDPADAGLAGRDRFVLSCGHSSLTLYIQLYLSGYPGMTLADLEALRTWGSRTPGHPEHWHTPGVEATTGPLGQGIGMAVGMAMAARRERGLLDPDAAPGTSPFDHHIYAFCSDGDIEEGITHEASSLAAHQELGNLVVIYDDNSISIEDDTNIAKSEDVAARYEAYGWHVQRVSWRRPGGYTEDVEALYAALAGRARPPGRPVVHRAAHHHRLARAEQAEHRRRARLGARRRRGRRDQEDPRLRPGGELPGRGRGAWPTPGWSASAASRRTPAGTSSSPPGRRPARSARRCWTGCPRGPCPTAGPTRCPRSRPARRAWPPASASGQVLNALAPVLPELWGGSADLAGSNDTTMKGEPSFIPADHQTKMFPGNPFGRTLHFGIREHAMGAILNGIALHGLTRPYGGTFLVFSDYMRGAVRLAALMKQPVTYVWTHDSIGLGEDGPTHQPVEHLWALRAIPGLDVVRPADASETAVAWKTILEHTDRPAGLCLTRQTSRSSTGRCSARRRGRGPRRLRAGRGRRRRRPRSSSSAPAARCRSRWPRGTCCRPAEWPPGWSPCRAWSGSPSRTRPTGMRCCRARSGPGSAWRRAWRSAGGSSSATWARASALSISAPRPTIGSCTRSSGSPPRPWRRRRGPAWPGRAGRGVSEPAPGKVPGQEARQASQKERLS